MSTGFSERVGRRRRAGLHVNLAVQISLARGTFVDVAVAVDDDRSYPGTLVPISPDIIPSRTASFAADGSLLINSQFG